MLIRHLETTRAIVSLDFMAKIVKEVSIIILNFIMGATLAKYHECGIPQGSCLGPFLFILYIIDFENYLAKISPEEFADDRYAFVLSVSL